MSYPPHPADPYRQQPYGGGFDVQHGGPYDGHAGPYGPAFAQQPAQPYEQQPHRAQPHYGPYGHPCPPTGSGNRPDDPYAPYGPGQIGDEYPEDEPPRNGRLIGITAGAVAVVASVVLFTGFVAPGFFLGDEPGTGQAQSGQQQDGQAGGAGTGPTLQGGQGPAHPLDGGPATDIVRVKQIATTVIEGLNTKNSAKVKTVSCNPENERQSDYDSFPDGIRWSIAGDATINGQRATIPVKVSGPAGERTSTLNFRKEGDGWCASSIG